MKALFALLALSFTVSAHAAPTPALDPATAKKIEAAVMADASVTKQLPEAYEGNLSIKRIKRGPVQVYDVVLSYTEAGLGMNGPSTHPCSIAIKVTEKVAENVMIVAAEEKVCAVNMPIRK